MVSMAAHMVEHDPSLVKSQSPVKSVHDDPSLLKNEHHDIQSNHETSKESDVTANDTAYSWAPSFMPSFTSADPPVRVEYKYPGNGVELQGRHDASPCKPAASPSSYFY